MAKIDIVTADLQSLSSKMKAAVLEVEPSLLLPLLQQNWQ